MGHVPMLAGRFLQSPKILGKRDGNAIAVETASLRKYINSIARKVASNNKPDGPAVGGLRAGGYG